MTERLTVISEIARGVSGLFVQAGCALNAKYPELELARLPAVQQGMLIAAIAMRRLLCSTAEGRQALRDLGFEPVFDDIQGE